MAFVGSVPIPRTARAYSKPYGRSSRVCATMKQDTTQASPARAGMRVLETPSAFGLLVRGARAGWNAAWRTMMAELAPSSSDGSYVRPRNVLYNRDALLSAKSSTLYYGVACGWCHRVTLARALLGLESRIDTVLLTPGEDGLWRLPNGGRLASIYASKAPEYRGRFTAPLLVSGSRVASNESGDCLPLLHELCNGRTVGGVRVQLQPTDDALCKMLQTDVNDGVYRCGFASTQAAYDAAERRLFAALDECEARLSRSAFLCGDTLTESDVRLFPTAYRLDSVYSVIFRTCRKSIRHDYPNIARWLAQVYELPGVSNTCDISATRSHYYKSLFPLNPGGIVPATPDPSLEAGAKFTERD